MPAVGRKMIFAGEGSLMRIDVLTIFPEIFESPLKVSLLGKAIQQNKLEVVLTDVREFTREAIIPFSFDGAGSAIATGVKYSGQFTIPFDCHLIGWTIIADQSGSIVVDFWKDTYANYPPPVADTITASDKPTLSAAQKNQNNNASTWTQAFSKGDIILPNVDSVTTVEQVVVFLRVAIL